MKSSVLRIIDVNLNRAREGLRVVEEVARFILDDAELTGALRSLRLELQKQTATLSSWQDIIKARDSQADVGANRSLQNREDIAEVIHANCCRVEEALRVLEEFSIDGLIFQRLRFEVYDIEKLCFSAWQNMLKKE